MRVLYHHRTQAEDAQGVHVRQMVKAFRALGHEVEIVALVQPSESGGQITGKRWRTAARHTSPAVYELLSLAYNLVGYVRLRRSIRRRRPDFIYERYSLNTFCGIWASRQFQVPLLLEVNAPLYREQRQLGELAFERLARFSERWICSQSTRTIVVSQVMKDILEQEGVPRDHMVVMPNGIDPAEFNPGISGQRVRHRYGLDEAVVVGFVGWFRKWHGLEALVEVMDEARLADRGVRLLLIGDGPAYADIHRCAADRGLGNAVIFTGPVGRDEIAAHIAAMDIAVQPSATEYACPMKILEYMAMAKCIVAPDQPNIREMLTDGDSGMLFRAGDKASLREKLEDLLLSPAKRTMTGRRAHESIFARRLLWRANAEQSLSLSAAEPELHVAPEHGKPSLAPVKRAPSHRQR